MTDDEIHAELQRRQDRDTGNRHDLDDVIARLGITREELAAENPWEDIRQQVDECGHEARFDTDGNRS